MKLSFSNMPSRDTALPLNVSQANFDKRTIVATKNQTMKKWYILAIVIGVVFLSVVIFGTIGLLHSYGVPLTQSLKCLIPAIEAVGHTPHYWSLWLMTIGTGVVSVSSIAFGIYKLFHSKNQIHNETEYHLPNDQNPPTTNIIGNDKSTIKLDDSQESSPPDIQDLNISPSHDSLTDDESTKNKDIQPTETNNNQKSSEAPDIQDLNTPTSHNSLAADESNKEKDKQPIEIPSASHKVPVEKRSTGHEQLDTLFQLSQEYSDLMWIAKSMTTPQFTYSIPNIPLSDVERARLSEATKQVEQMEIYFKTTYGDEINSFMWHGRLSFHRILFQDQHFLEALQDPLFIKALLLRAKNQQETSLGSMVMGFTLSSLLIYGLISNRVSYLATATPNWERFPQIVDWTDLKHLLDVEWRIKVNKAPLKDDTSREITEEYAQQLSKALFSINSVFKSLNLQLNPPDETVKKIGDASVQDALDLFNQVIKTDLDISILTYGTKNSQPPIKLAKEAFEVMAHYAQILEYHKNDHAKALGYGIISHAFDARHLAAAIYYLDKPLDTSKGNFDQHPLEYYEKGRSAIRSLLNGARDGSIGPVASQLVRARVQQMLDIVYNPSRTDQEVILAAALTNTNHFDGIERNKEMLAEVRQFFSKRS